LRFSSSFEIAGGPLAGATFVEVVQRMLALFVDDQGCIVAADQLARHIAQRSFARCRSGK
jgi:hypothetical protein